MVTTEYDLIVLGAGSAGENVADYAVQGGVTALLVESELVGGECSYWACMPSKTLLRSAQALRAAQHVDGAAQAITGTIDVQHVLDRRDSFTHHWSDASQVSWAEGAGIDVVRGIGRISAPKQITVTAPDGTATTYTARHAVAVAVGSRPLIPPIAGLVEAQPWTSREATSVKQIPTRFAIIGGGVVAAEMATAYAGLGSTVTLISRGGLLAGMEPFAGEMVHQWMQEQGIHVLLNTETTGVTRRDGEVTITTNGGDTIIADEVLIATGRTPATSDIGLETIGLTPGDWMSTDDTLRVDGYDWLYAVGDVNHRALLTHQGKYQARAAGSVIAARALGETILDEPWGEHVATADHQAVPQVTFTEPEVASVGLTSEAAAKAGYETRVIDYEIGYLAGSSVREDDYTGTARMVVDEKRQRLLGVTFVGPDVSELIQTATLAIVADVPMDRLWHMVPAYPTVNEIWLRLLETYGRPAHHLQDEERQPAYPSEAVA
ncbi:MULTISPECIES: dihydrolipoyl dehydrogenase family protein [unclassified Leifsonia]|uniref:dihydrolipoyl dehydrogenase family protein n=1 Tax=unclassified Leifsonia TaxID=2663824 RepID=UPI0006FFBE1E|nr:MULTISPECIES: NAD(P)/FAD-dependent oxidoreductase [unclassified Leifsonia]KQX07746.1 pyridine nucleotide-disulfide oxidoreductase [Leifsonia sp. Root1293]KRA12028.1 pyridine nucleotide-disulfide oxidoreductase [Leifsonia sp. Root60]